MLNKNRIKKVVKSLQHANREILKENKIDEILDDYIYLQVRMKYGIRDKPKIGEAQSATSHTPVQISLNQAVTTKDALLIVRNDSKAKFQTIIMELNLGSQFQVATYEEVYGSKKM